MRTLSILALGATVLFAPALVAGRAVAQDDDDSSETPPRVRVDGATVHQAARLLAEVHEVGVWVVAPEGGRLQFSHEGEAEAAFAALASAAGLATRRRELRTGEQYWVADEPRLLRAESASIRGLSGGRRIDLDFERVQASELAALLGSVSRLSVRGMPVGTVTVHMREGRSTRALETLARLADSRVARRGREVAFRLGNLPPGRGRPWSECEATLDRPPNLTCTPVEEMRLVGLSPEHALIAAPNEAAAVVRVGDYVGNEGWRVVAIGEDRIELEREGVDPRALVLGGGS